MMRFLTISLLLVLCLLSIVSSSASSSSSESSASVSSDPPLSSYSVADLPESVRKLRVKQLIELLDEKGHSCDGCTEKSDVLEKVASVYHLPTIDAELRPSAKKTKVKAESEEKIIEEVVNEANERDDSEGSEGSNDEDPFAHLPDDIRATFMKKRKDEDEIIKKLRAAGINVDPSQLNGGNGFGSFARAAKNAKKMKGGKAARSQKKKQRGTPNKPKAPKASMEENNANKESNEGVIHEEL